MDSEKLAGEGWSNYFGELMDKEGPEVMDRIEALDRESLRGCGSQCLMREQGGIGQALVYGPCIQLTSCPQEPEAALSSCPVTQRWVTVSPRTHKNLTSAFPSPFLAILVSQGCHPKLPETRWFKTTDIPSQWRRPELWNQGNGKVVFFWRLWERMSSMPLT